MAFTTKLDTNVITIINMIHNNKEGQIFRYNPSRATIELNDVNAYYAFIDHTGKTRADMTVLVMGAPRASEGGNLIVTESYETIDGLINP